MVLKMKSERNASQQLRNKTCHATRTNDPAERNDIGPGHERTRGTMGIMACLVTIQSHEGHEQHDHGFVLYASNSFETHAATEP